MYRQVLKDQLLENVLHYQKVVHWDNYIIPQSSRYFIKTLPSPNHPQQRIDRILGANQK